MTDERGRGRALIVGLAVVGQFACGSSKDARPAPADSSGGATVSGVAGGTSSVSGGGAATTVPNSGGSSAGGAPGGVATGGASSSGGAAQSGGGSSASAGATGFAGSAGSTAAGTGPPETTPVGYGKAATGGGNTTPISVSTMAGMQAAIDAYAGSGGLVLEYTGTFDFSTIPDPCTQHTLPAQTVEIKGKSDITILGKAGSAANFGIHVAAASSNIIIRNMTIGLTPGGGDSDLISLEGVSAGVPTNIWIDHNELFTSMAVCAGAGDTAFDGMVDVKKGADNVTVSYNYMHDHHKVSLNGFTDTDDAIRHITFDHNLFENIGSRVPLQRHGYSHVLNNYFSGVTASGVNVRMGGYSLVEANYFENVVNPVTARDSTAIGYWDLRNNNLLSAADVAPGNRFGITWDAGSAGTVNATSWTTTAAYPVALGYDYTADPAQCIHDGLRAAVGAGKDLVTLKCK
jgi:pectate lyase